jgi:polysaccharide export outer membrane protein
MHRQFCQLALLLTLFVSSATAQTAHRTESLLIGPGDVLHVQVYDTPEFEQHPRVDDVGNIPLLFLGSIPVVGDTPGQAAAAISNSLVSNGVMLHPQVSVVIEQYATQDVSIMGQVNKPGSYPIATPRSIFALLSMAGGLTPFAERIVLVRRRGTQGTQETFSVPDTPNADFTTDLEIYPGDTIIVPKASFAYVLGDVARPGGYPMNANDLHLTALEVLADAGSANKTAALSGVKLLRKTKTGYDIIPIKLSALERGEAADFPLEADDVIFVPFSYAKNFVLNAAALATSVASATLFIP